MKKRPNSIPALIANQPVEPQVAPSSWTRRQFLGYSALAGVGLAAAPILTACETSSKTTTKALKKTTSLTIADPYVGQNLDRELNVADNIMHEYNLQIVAPLVDWKKKPTADGNYTFDFSGYVPVLAESWDISNGGRTITWHLRKGVKSSAGNELTAEILKWNYDRGFALKGVGAFFMQVFGVDSPDDVKVLGQYDLSLTSKQPCNLWLSAHCQHMLGPLDAVEYRKHATSDDPWAHTFGTQNVIGWGPLQIQSRTVGQQCVMTPNPNWFGAPSQFQEVIFKEVPDAAVRYSLLIQQQVDAAKNLSFRQMAELKGRSDIRINNQLSSFQGVVSMNGTHPPLNDPRVRQALTYAVPYDEILHKVFYDLASKEYGPLNQIFLTFDKSLWQYKTDINKAKSLLKEAGQSSGFQLHLSYPNDVPEDEPLVLLLKSSFQQIGVDVILDKMTPADAVQTVFTFKHQLGMFHAGTNDPDPYYAFYLFYRGGAGENVSQISATDIDQMIDQGLVSQNQDERNTLSKKIQQRIIEECPFLYMVENGLQFPARANIHGMYQRMTRDIMYNELVQS